MILFYHHSQSIILCHQFKLNIFIEVGVIIHHRSLKKQSSVCTPVQGLFFGFTVIHSLACIPSVASVHRPPGGRISRGTRSYGPTLRRNETYYGWWAGLCRRMLVVTTPFLFLYIFNWPTLMINQLLTALINENLREEQSSTSADIARARSNK
jgi:hypothetical protein